MFHFFIWLFYHAKWIKKKSIWWFSDAFWSKHVYFASLPYYAIVKWLNLSIMTLTLLYVEKWTTKNDVSNFCFLPSYFNAQCASIDVFGFKIELVVFCRWSFEVVIVLFAHCHHIFVVWVRVEKTNRAPGDVLRHPGVSTNDCRLYNFLFVHRHVLNVHRLATVKITQFLERKELRKRTQLKLKC